MFEKQEERKRQIMARFPATMSRGMVKHSNQFIPSAKEDKNLEIIEVFQFKKIVHQLLTTHLDF